MDSIQRTALIQPELVASVPKKNDKPTWGDCLCGAIRTIKNAPIEVKVMGLIGAVCGLGAIATLAGACFSSPPPPAAIESAESLEGRFNSSRANLPVTLATGECTYIKWRFNMTEMPSETLSGENCCFSESKCVDSTYFTYNNNQSDINTANKSNFYLNLGINDANKTDCLVKEFSILRGDILTSDHNVHKACKIYDLTKSLETAIVDNGEVYSVLECINPDTTLENFITDLKHFGKRCYEKSPDKEHAKSELKRLADAYESIEPNLGLGEALMLYANNGTKAYETSTENFGTLSASLYGISSAFGILGLISTGATIAIATIDAINSKTSIHYHPEGKAYQFVNGKEKITVELGDSGVNYKIPVELSKSCENAMKGGAAVGDVYEMAIDVCDHMDKLTGNTELGSLAMIKVQKWFFYHHRNQFDKYCKEMGIDYVKPLPVSNIV